MTKYCIVSLMFLLSCLYLAGCGEEQEEENPSYIVYMLNRDETKLKPYRYQSDTEETSAVVKELLELMSEAPEQLEYHEVFRDFMVTGYNIKDNVVTVSVSTDYLKLEPTTEVLTRAAIVRTLCQVDGVDYVMMKVGNRELKDRDGKVVGVMNEEQFVDNEGNEINTYENVELALYFASEDGTRLIKAIRSVEYSSNISMEKLLVEKLIGGPRGKGLYPTVNPDTKIENITVKDGICYVNLSREFLIQCGNVKPEVTIYSIVNTLAELESVNKVQISISGDTDVMFRDVISLETLFERNLDIVLKEEEL